MIRRSLIAMVVAFAMVAGGSGSAFAGEKIVNGIDANFPPFAFINKAGEPSGFDVESMNWIAKEMGFEVEHKPIDWDGIITSLLIKKIDVIASGMSITPDRAKKVDFTIPYWKIKQVMGAGCLYNDLCSYLQDLSGDAFSDRSAGRLHFRFNYLHTIYQT